jgi:hypothetical protein
VELADVDQTFRWDETRELLSGCPELAVDEHRGGFIGEDDAGVTFRVRPPLIQPIGEDIATSRQFVAGLEEELGSHLVILMQAGAASLGWFEEGERVRTKTIKKYVVRGHGKAQPTHLSTKGKSRYGSRLRLQQAKALLVEINERLHDWFDEFGEPAHVFYSCPTRMWPELFGAKPAPPFDRDDSLIKIPLDLPVPTTDVLLRTYKGLTYGSVDGV